VLWADLHPRSGAEPRGGRPAIVVSNDGFNLTPSWRSVIVVPLSTSEAQARRAPTTVLLPAGSGSLGRPSVALCHQVTTLDRAKLTERGGILPVDLLAHIDSALKAALELD
jgi:mRNA-degrading endonuclease toxin of MazEF toxin-antitoxin module